jgi:hypothetical protein
MGWATFGADFVADAGGDYEGCVRDLLEAGARPQPNEYLPKHEGVRTVIEHFRTVGRPKPTPRAD